MASYEYIPPTPYEHVLIQLKCKIVPTPYAATNDACFACSAKMPYDWPQMTGHFMYGTCSKACAAKRRTHCKWRYCDEALDPWAESYPFCCYGCKGEDDDDRLQYFRDCACARSRH